MLVLLDLRHTRDSRRYFRHAFQTKGDSRDLGLDPIFTGRYPEIPYRHRDDRRFIIIDWSAGNITGGDVPGVRSVLERRRFLYRRSLSGVLKSGLAVY